MKRHHVLRPMSSFPSLTFELGERWRHVEKQNLGRVEGGTDASLRTVGYLSTSAVTPEGGEEHADTYCVERLSREFGGYIQ